MKKRRQLRRQNPPFDSSDERTSDGVGSEAWSETCGALLVSRVGESTFRRSRLGFRPRLRLHRFKDNQGLGWEIVSLTKNLIQPVTEFMAILISFGLWSYYNDAYNILCKSGRIATGIRKRSVCRGAFQ